jgi:hypothetical protein
LRVDSTPPRPFQSSRQTRLTAWVPGRPVAGRTRGADSCLGSPRRASAAPHSAAAPLRRHPRQRSPAAGALVPRHPSLEQSSPQRFHRTHRTTEGGEAPLLPTGTWWSLRDSLRPCPLRGFFSEGRGCPWRPKILWCLSLQRHARPGSHTRAHPPSATRRHPRRESS